ncbi:MAG: hypothetical protein AAGE52_03705 [Myxococcota bacterium]
MRWGLIAMTMLLMGGWHANDQPALIQDEPFVFRPSVTAELTYRSERSPVGWGSFDLTAAPERNEIRVDLLLGTPASVQRWTCGRMELDIDGDAQSLSVNYAGVPMNGGVYDAVSAKLSIEDVRAMHRARNVAVNICGERVDLPRAERTRLRDFVEDFDDIGLYVGPSAPTPPPELGPEHEWLISDPIEPGDFPAPV